MKRTLILMLLSVVASMLGATGCADEAMVPVSDTDPPDIEAKSARVGPHDTPVALSAEDFQDYVVEVLDFARLAYEDPAPNALPVHGVMHDLRPEWGTSKFRIYQKVLPGEPATVSYVVGIEGTASVGDALRDVQAVLARVRTTNPLTGDSGGRIASGFAALVRNYMNGQVGGDAFAGLLDDLEERLERGERVEMVVTGHSLGAAASYIFSWYMWQYLEQAWPDAPVHIRNFAFASPKTFSPWLARDFSDAVYSDGSGPFRLQSYTFTRTGDAVTYGGSPLVHHPMWAPNRGDGWVNRNFRRRNRRNIGHCSHVNLSARGGPLANHSIDLFREDLSDHDTWSEMAECMAKPARGADQPGFKTFWGPGGDAGDDPEVDHGRVNFGEEIGLVAAHDRWLCAESNLDMVADRQSFGAWERFEVRDRDGRASGRELQWGDTISLFTHHGRYVVAEPDGRLEANRENVGSWERFRIVDANDPDRRGPVTCLTTIALETAHGTYVVGRPDGAAEADEGNLSQAARLRLFCQ